MFDIAIGVIASLIAAFILYIINVFIGPYLKLLLAPSVSAEKYGRERALNEKLIDESASLIKINCPRCGEKNTLKNTDCNNCGYSDVARKRIIDRGILGTLIFSIFSIIIFPFNTAAGILAIIISIKSYIYLKIAGFFIPIIAIAKVFGFFEEYSWSQLGVGTLVFLGIAVISTMLEYAIEEENSIPRKILEFLILFLFPYLFIFLYLNYYRPREVAENISNEARRNLQEPILIGTARKIFMSKYKKRDAILDDISEIVAIGKNANKEYTFLNDYLYKYFSSGSHENVLIGYAFVVIIYIFMIFNAIGFFNI